MFLQAQSHPELERAKDQHHNRQRRVTLKCDLGYICIPMVLRLGWSGWKRSSQQSCLEQDGWVDGERKGGNCCNDKCGGWVYFYAGGEVVSMTRG